MNNSRNMYKEIQLSADINSGNKKQFLIMMYDAVILNLNEAINAIKTNNIQIKLAKVDKVLSIIEKGLIMSLSKDGAKEVAESLEMFYEDASQLIILANLKNDANMLNNVKTSFSDLKLCWAKVVN